jgi:hypothetical protein
MRGKVVVVASVLMFNEDDEDEDEGGSEVKGSQNEGHPDFESYFARA